MRLLIMATSALQLGRRRQSSLQCCQLYYLHTPFPKTLHTFQNYSTGLAAMAVFKRNFATAAKNMIRACSPVVCSDVPVAVVPLNGDVTVVLLPGDGVVKVTLAEVTLAVVAVVVAVVVVSFAVVKLPDVVSVTVAV